MNIGDKAKIDGRFDLGVVTIVDLDGGTAFVELKSGVEMEFSETKLVSPDTVAKETKVAWKAPELTNTWINETIPGSIIEQAMKMHTKTANSVRGTPKWNNLQPVKKMDVIAAMSGVRTSGLELYKNMRSGKISPIQLSVMTGENLQRVTFQDDHKE